MRGAGVKFRCASWDCVAGTPTGGAAAKHWFPGIFIDWAPHTENSKRPFRKRLNRKGDRYRIWSPLRFPAMPPVAEPGFGVTVLFDSVDETFRATG